MNALFDTHFKGTLGELITQTFLLAHGVQAAPPIKDSGNDLIAVRGGSFRAVQVRTSARGLSTGRTPLAFITYWQPCICRMMVISLSLAKHGYFSLRQSK
jgi:hypothetical protein